MTRIEILKNENVEPSLSALYFSFSLRSTAADEGQSQKILFVFLESEKHPGPGCRLLRCGVKERRVKHVTLVVCLPGATLFLLVLLSHVSLRPVGMK